jgi:hypothetical protein
MTPHIVPGQTPTKSHERRSRLAACYRLLLEIGSIEPSQEQKPSSDVHLDTAKLDEDAALKAGGRGHGQ